MTSPTNNTRNPPKMTWVSLGWQWKLLNTHPKPSKLDSPLLFVDFWSLDSNATFPAHSSSHEYLVMNIVIRRRNENGFYFTWRTESSWCFHAIGWWSLTLKWLQGRGTSPKFPVKQDFHDLYMTQRRYWGKLHQNQHKETRSQSMKHLHILLIDNDRTAISRIVCVKNEIWRASALATIISRPSGPASQIEATDAYRLLPHQYLDLYGNEKAWTETSVVSHDIISVISRDTATAEQHLRN